MSLISKFARGSGLFLFIAMVEGNVAHAQENAVNARGLSFAATIVATPDVLPRTSWEPTIRFMKNVSVYDDIVETMMNVVCGPRRAGSSSSVLLVGSGDAAYRYVFARLAAGVGSCAKFHHAELDNLRLSAGHSTVGSNEAFWKNNVQAAAYYKPVVLYTTQLLSLLSVGTHRGDDQGLGPMISTDLASGALRLVAFADEYSLGQLREGKYNQALSSFTQVIRLPELTPDRAEAFLTAYAKFALPSATFDAETRQYLSRMAEYYQPNASEPFRSIRILDQIGRDRPVAVAITREDVDRGISKSLLVPPWIVARDFKVLEGLRAKLDQDVVGIDVPKADVVALAQRGYRIRRMDGKPVASFLFVGSTGTGKTYLAEKTAEYLGLPLVTIDMTYYASPASLDRFIDTMGRYLAEKPYAVYLFEEIEKADEGVRDRLYLLLDKGVFNDLNQRPLFARGAFVIMTTNAAQETILRDAASPGLRDAVLTELFKSFRSSFLNRFDRISVFKPFTDSEYQQLAATMLSRSARDLKKHSGITLSFTPEVKDYVVKHGSSPVFGARPMQRLVGEIIELGVAEFQMKHAAVPPEAKAELSKAASEHGFVLKIGETSVEYSIR